MGGRGKIMTAATTVVAVVVVICALVIMYLQLGTVGGYDFGAGAYYYADIPGYGEIFHGNSYKASVPTWVHIMLFLAWGWLMYRLWIWVDRNRC